MAYFYVLFSVELNCFYVGSTRGSLEERLRRHLSEHKGYTAKAKDWKVVYDEYFEMYVEAYRREKHIKSLKDRKLLIDLINTRPL